MRISQPYRRTLKYLELPGIVSARSVGDFSAIIQGIVIRVSRLKLDQDYDGTSLLSELVMEDSCTCSSYLSSGCQGDIIYSLPSIRARGTGHYYFADRPWTKPLLNRLGALTPLLEIQPCISGISTYAGEVVDYDLSTFRSGGLKYGDTVIERQARWIGAKVDISEPWLEAGDPDPRTFGKIVINRCPRWPGFHFPWRELVEEFGGEMTFLGLEQEYRDFIKGFGQVEFLPTKNLLEVANLISGCALFIGNQSCPLAIAEGLHKRTIIEACCFAMDCIHRRSGNIHCIDGGMEFRALGKHFKSPSRAKEGIAIEVNLMARAKALLDSLE